MGTVYVSVPVTASALSAQPTNTALDLYAVGSTVSSPWNTVTEASDVPPFALRVITA